MVDHRLGDLVAPEGRLSCLPRVVLMGGEEAELAYSFSNFFILIRYEAAAEPAHFGPASGVVSGSAFLLEVQGQQHLARY